jgi:hypothetical protein
MINTNNASKLFIVFCWRYWCLSYFAGVIGVYRILLALLGFIVVDILFYFTTP